MSVKLYTRNKFVEDAVRAQISDIEVIHEEPQKPKGLLIIDYMAHSYLAANMCHEGADVVVICVPDDEQVMISLIHAGVKGIVKEDETDVASVVTSVEVNGMGFFGQQAVLAKKARGMKITKLTKRERQIWELFSSGVKRTTIADMLFISRRTVDVHIQNIYKKKGINSQIEAIATKYDKV